MNSSKLKPNKNPKSKEFIFSRFSPTCDVRVPHTARIFVWNVTQAAICQMKYVLLQFPWLSSRIPLHNLSKLLTLFIILRDWKNSHVVYADDENYTAKFTIRQGHALPFDPQHATDLYNIVLFLIRKFLTVWHRDWNVFLTFFYGFKMLNFTKNSEICTKPSSR